MVEGGNHGMKRRNIILLISIPLGIMLIVYYGLYRIRYLDPVSNYNRKWYFGSK